MSTIETATLAPGAALPLDHDEISAARERLRGIAVRTPLLEYRELNCRVGGRVLLKAETFQRAGSFKFRGAYNRLAQLTRPERKRGVVAYSSGNHALGIATAAAMVGTAATLVMPHDAPRIKLDKVRRSGARIVFYDRISESREQLAQRIADDTGAIVVPSFDDRHIVAGQATVAAEAFDQLSQRDLSADQLLASCGGGGLTAGCALAAACRSATTKVYAVEPLGFERIGRSLLAGTPVSIQGSARSICDSLMVPSPGHLTFAILRALLAGTAAVSDAEVAAAMLAAFLDAKLVLEPGGAAALAAVLSSKIDGRDKTTVVVCSGGNVDAETYTDLLHRASKDMIGGISADARLRVATVNE